MPRRKRLCPVAISDRNTKMGAVPSISLPPCSTCAPDAPCLLRCYILKAWRMYKATRAAYRRNIRLYHRDPAKYFGAIHAYLTKKVPTYFRWHVGGDVPDKDYLGWILSVAKANPETRFLLFTKRYQWVADYTAAYPTPGNLSIVLSAWPGYPLFNPHNLPVAWMQDGTETRVTDTALPCPGNCEDCGLCFRLADTNCDVVFNAH